MNFENCLIEAKYLKDECPDLADLFEEIVCHCKDVIGAIDVQHDRYKIKREVVATNVSRWQR
jgi:hypothetical protein